MLKHDGFYLPTDSNRPKTTKGQKVPSPIAPHNIQAEEAVLGSALIDQDAIFQVSDFLKPRDFFLRTNGQIYQGMLALATRRERIDIVTLHAELEKLGWGEDIPPHILTDLINATPTSVHAPYYAKIVERCAVRRRLMSAAQELFGVAQDDIPGEIDELLSQGEAIIAAVSNSRLVVDDYNRPIGSIVDEIFDDLENPKPKEAGLPSGIKDLDRTIGGFRKAGLYIVAGRPSMGKTTLALQIALKTAAEGKRVTIFSLDQSAQSVGMRMLSHLSGVSLTKIRDHKLEPADTSALIRAANVLKEQMAIKVIDVPAYQLTPTGLKAIVLRNQMRGEKDDLIMVDYIQLMIDPAFRGKGADSRNHEIGSISGNLKGLARELDIPVIALSQLSRAVEGRHDKRPMMSDMRDSGSIEQDADVALAMYRDEYYNPGTEFPHIAEILVLKQKDGPTGAVSCYFKKETFKMVDLEVRKEPLSY